MRLHALCLTGAVIAAAIPLSGGATPVAGSRGKRQRSASRVGYLPLSSRFYCEPDAYAPHGKFRPAHCAPRW